MQTKIRFLLLVFLSFFFNNVLAQKLERYNKLNDTTLVSKILPHSKSISIYLPSEWQEDIDNKFPLTIVFDRQNSGINNYIINTIDFLTAKDQIPASIIVSIDSKRHQRYIETNHLINDTKGLAEKNAQFLFKELIPMLEKHYKANAFRLFIGHSRYAFFSTDLFANYTNAITAVIAMDPFFEDGKINLNNDLNKLSNKDFKHYKYFRYSLGKNNIAEVKPAEKTFTSLKNDKINHKSFVYSEALHNAIPGLTISNALYDVYEFWSKQQNTLIFNESEFNDIKHYNTEVKKHYGEYIPLSISGINGMANAFFAKKEYKKAIESWSILLENYPNFSYAYLKIIQSKKKLNLDTKETLLKFKKSLEKSTLFTKEQKIEMLKSIE